MGLHAVLNSHWRAQTGDHRMIKLLWCGTGFDNPYSIAPSIHRVVSLFISSTYTERGFTPVIRFYGKLLATEVRLIAVGTFLCSRVSGDYIICISFTNGKLFWSQDVIWQHIIGNVLFVCLFVCLFLISSGGTMYTIFMDSKREALKDWQLTVFNNIR